jgi:ankyrin repeat protein
MASLITHGLHVDITDAGEKMAISLIKRGADVNSLDVEDTSPLQLAALYGREKLVETLLEHDTNPLLTSLMGHSAF